MTIKEQARQLELLRAWATVAAVRHGREVEFFETLDQAELKKWLGLCDKCSLDYPMLGSW